MAYFVLVIGLAGTASSWLLFRRTRRARRFVPVPGRIVERSVGGVLSAPLPGGSFGIRVKYVYQVDGSEFVGDRIGFFERGYDRATAEKKLAELPNEVTVYVDPSHPSDAVIERQGTGVAFTCGAVGVILTTVALLMLWAQHS